MLLTQILRFTPQVGILAMLLTPPLTHLPLPTAWQTTVWVQGSVVAGKDQEPISRVLHRTTLYTPRMTGLTCIRESTTRDTTHSAKPVSSG